MFGADPYEEHEEHEEGNEGKTLNQQEYKSHMH